jgi:N-acylneuraminate cytidylyltransferase
MKILGIIPARGGSKGIPGKNIKLLGGKPLLQYTVESAKASVLLNRVILSSDDEKIIAVARGLGLEVPFVRPAELAGDATGSLEVIQHAVNYLKGQGEEYDAVCLLQPTAPFRSRGLIDEAIEKFRTGNYDSVISVRELPEDFNPHWIFEEKNGSLVLATGEKEIITRRQDLPKGYHRDGAIYITKTSVLLEQNSLYGNKIGFVNTSGSPYVNIDTEEDWGNAIRLVKSGKWKVERGQ